MKRSGFFLTLYSLLFFGFIYLPLAVIVIYSFNSNATNMMVWEHFTLNWYVQLFGFADNGAVTDATYLESTDQLISALKNSLIVASCTTIFATVIGTSLAVAVARYRFRLRGFYQNIMMLPMMMPDIVLGIGLLIFFMTVGMQLSLLTIIIGQSTFLISYVFIIVSARIAGIDPALEEASADLGANSFTTFRKVLLPQIAPGVFGGAMLAFIISMDDLVITYFIAGTGDTTLPMFIFAMVRRGIKPEINAIAVMIILVSILVASIGFWLRGRSNE